MTSLNFVENVVSHVSKCRIRCKRILERTLTLRTPMWVTLGIGWIIWSLIVWGKGQSPAKQILKIRIYAAETGLPASWGHTAIYQFLIGWTLALLCGFLNFFTFGIIGSLAYVAIWVTDFCWFYKDRKCRTLRDLVCKTLIINVA